MKKTVVGSLLGSQAGTGRSELGITHGSLGRAVPIGLDFPPGSAYLAARHLAAWLLTKRLLREKRRWLPATGAAAGLGQASCWASCCYRGAFVS